MYGLLIVTLLAALSHSEQVSTFDNYKVYRITPETEEQIQSLSELENTNSGYDFWSFGRNGHPIDVMVAPYMEDQFAEIVQSKGLRTEVFIENVQEIIDNETPSVFERASTGFGWNAYHTLDEINDWLKSLVQKYPNTVSLIKGGSSYEGRDILGVYVSFSSNNTNRGVFLEGGIHAREWISPATVTYILSELLTSTDSGVRQIADSHDWYVFPSVNPDGFVYTHTNIRLWRKTRKPYSAGCYGSDPNRNWGFQWNKGGVSNQPCSDTYAGSSAFSDVETKTLSEYITNIAPRLRAYISFHSYSQFILIPYGVTGIGRPNNYDDLFARGNRAATALSSRYGTQYVVGNIVDALYVASGSSVDWIKGVHDVELAFVYELRDNGRYGFMLPADQIIPTGEETLDSVIELLKA